MDLHGKNFLGGNLSAEGDKFFSAVNPASGETLAPEFCEASPAEIEQAVSLAEAAFGDYRSEPAERIALFLEAIAQEILQLGEALIQRAQAETALPEPRLIGERARTVNQIKMFAELVREGSWVEASIDRAIPDRKPVTKPDLRRRLIPLGPVAVFGASNFPLAFSVAGGDTISALAAGNPVVVKAHPAHPGTSELVASAVVRALHQSQMPAGIFSMLHGAGHHVSLGLVRHHATKAVGFTGSWKAGRALFDVAAARAEPIPVYAEMGSTNPIFILPSALKKSGNSIAEGLMQSVAMGVGQFCTNPGLVFGCGGTDLATFLEMLGRAAADAAPGTMLGQGIRERFLQSAEAFEKTNGVRIVEKSRRPAGLSEVPAMVFATDAKAFLRHEALREEMFGPSTMLVACDSQDELEQIARTMQGQLTATVFATEEDLLAHRDLISLLEQKVGRLLFNQFPTGVEVCPSMHHGGPYPATTDSRVTSVGTAAIKRFARPICFQNFPDAALPVELQNRNARNIWRLVDNRLTKEDC
ncbi:MAG: aldehyde dehydrogenase (NADP(+)) [Verrucomicrobiota bacterium]